MPDLSNRELSWLAFNERVLQEASDPTVPLLERAFFCGVFASNLDEFFSVRVASLRYLLRLPEVEADSLDFNPFRLLHDVHRVVSDQDIEYARVLDEILASLRAEGVVLVDHLTVGRHHHDFLRSYYQDVIREHIEVAFLDAGDLPFLQNKALYLVAEVWPKDQKDIRSWAPSYGFIKVPAPPLARWVELPTTEDAPHELMALDDVIRYNLDLLCGRREVGRAYSVTLTRDAELYLDEVFDGNLAEAIRKSLGRRETGAPSRFVYEIRSPYVMVHQMQHTLGLTEEDLVVGGRHHNLSDLMSLPRFDRTDLQYEAWPPLPHPELDGAASIVDAVLERDQVIHTPYQSFDHVVRFIQEAAEDPEVEEIWLTVYRAARDSAILNALIDAASKGKRVVTFLEIQARFDEESNLDWAERLEAAGAEVLLPRAGLKVHAKIALIVRKGGDGRRSFVYVGTGNFNEKSAKAYADHGIFTADERITKEIEDVFRELEGGPPAPDPEHLLVAPRTLREGFYALIEAEAQAARRGEPSGITLKMNALEDPEIIRRLYDASRAGVPIDIIVRGICRLVPGVPDRSETIRVRSILDRYLEHARIYIFHNAGAEKMYIASADWMTRNLSRRVEVAMPVYDPEVRRQLRRLIDLQLADNVKARAIDALDTNGYVSNGDDPIRAQADFRRFVADLAGR